MKRHFAVLGLTTPGEASTRSLKIETLAMLRWLAITGQATAIAFVHFGLGYPLPIIRCTGLILISAFLNLILKIILPANYRFEGLNAAALLGYDVCQLGAVLYLTGGLDNPFSFLLMAPVLVSATTLPSRSTLVLGILVAVLATLLVTVHNPLPWSDVPKPVLPPLYLAGIWIALLSTLAFTASYAFRVSDEARQLANALAAAELVLLREQHLSALDGLAAAAAHELGTPLGTIAVVARELERDLEPGSPLAEDIALLKSQSNRCRDILRKLTDLGSEQDLYFVRMPLTQLVAESVEPFRGFGREITLVEQGSGSEPIGTRNPAILHGLANLIENAVDFAAARVDVIVAWDTTSVSVTISDDGPGFHPAIIDRVGEPFVTSRADRTDDRDGLDFAGNLGLGFFIAKTLMIRSGAVVSYANRQSPETGAIIKIIWPRTKMDLMAATNSSNRFGTERPALF